MPVIECKVCSDNIPLFPKTASSLNVTSARCARCGSTMTIPRPDSDSQAALFNQVNQLRIAGEYCRAMDICRDYLPQDSAEAHWYTVLARYGAVYVKECGYRLECRRIQPDSLFEDADYLAALRLTANPCFKEMYREEASKIVHEQTRMQIIASEAPACDIFISCAERDEGAESFAIALNLHRNLTETGKRVFFEPVTPERLDPVKREPYVYAALCNARVMLAVGTKLEHYTAEAARCDWSRYIHLMRRGGYAASKWLILCCGDLRPRQLPTELAGFHKENTADPLFIERLYKRLAARDIRTTAET